MSICDEDASLPNRIEKAWESEKRPKLYLGKVFLDKRREIHRATERRSWSTFISSWNGPASLQNRKPKAREPKFVEKKSCSQTARNGLKHALNRFGENRFSTQNGPRLGHSLRNGGRAVHKLLFQQGFSVMLPWQSGLRRWIWGLLDLLPQVQDPRPAKIARRFLGFWSHLATVLTSKMKFLAMVSICPALFGHIFAVSAFLVILLDSSGWKLVKIKMSIFFVRFIFSMKFGTWKTPPSRVSGQIWAKNGFFL